jgi:hypothetical protein
LSRPVRWALWGWTATASAAWIGAWLDYPDKVIEFGIPAILFLVVGSLLTIRVRGNLIGPVLVIGASAWLIYDIGRAYATASLERGPFPLEHFAAWLGAWTGPVAFLMVPVLLTLFPDGRFSGRRRWFLVPFGLVIGLVLVGAVMLWGVPADALVDDDLIDRYASYDPIDAAYPLSGALIVPAAISLALRYRRGSPLERQQSRWLLASVLIAPIAAFIAFRFLDLEDYSGLVLAAAVSTLPAAIGVAILRYRLYDLGRVVSRTVSYAVVIGVLGLVFVFGVVYVPNQLMGSEAPAWLVAASTLAAAALFNPLRRRVVGWIDRRFNRSRYDNERVLDGFADTLRDGTDAVLVKDGWAAVVTETMQPAAIGVWVR